MTSSSALSTGRRTMASRSSIPWCPKRRRRSRRKVTMNKARLLPFDLETYRTRDLRQVERLQAEALEKRPAQNTLKDLKTQWDTAAAREGRCREVLDKTAVDV